MSDRELIINPVYCPKCSSELVHDEHNAFDRCLSCGWWNKRGIKGAEKVFNTIIEDTFSGLDRLPQMKHLERSGLNDERQNGN